MQIPSYSALNLLQKIAFTVYDFLLSLFQQVRTVFTPASQRIKDVFSGQSVQASISHFTAVKSWLICHFFSVQLNVQLWPHFSFVGSLGLTVWIPSVEKGPLFVVTLYSCRVFSIPLPPLMQSPNLQRKQRTMRCSYGVQ